MQFSHFLATLMVSGLLNVKDIGFASGLVEGWPLECNRHGQVSIGPFFAPCCLC